MARAHAERTGPGRRARSRSDDAGPGPSVKCSISPLAARASLIDSTSACPADRRGTALPGGAALPDPDQRQATRQLLPVVSLTYGIAVTGLPAISVPCGFTRNGVARWPSRSSAAAVRRAPCPRRRRVEAARSAARPACDSQRRTRDRKGTALWTPETRSRPTGIESSRDAAEARRVKRLRLRTPVVIHSVRKK